MDTIKSISEFDWNRNRGVTYVQDENIKVWYGGGQFDQIVITDLENALKTGNECFSVVYNTQYGAPDCALINFIESVGGIYAAMITDIEPPACIERYTRSKQSIRVFSPFVLDRIKPLKEAPKKWTLKHAIRAILNGQAKDLKCNGVYTDDYAWDAECNFRRGLLNNIMFAKKLIEDPGGWRAWDHGNGIISVSCHSFDCNEFTLAIN